jgi:beta-glucosidase
VTSVTFPEGFVWGVATSAYQIEGGAKEGGKGESIWDRFTHTRGTISDGSTGDVACDHYHRWPEDVALMKELGIGAYRFSLSWARLLPEGWGRTAPAGIDFYSRLVDGLLHAGIEPYVTLYHWDLPQALQDMGGWPARDTAKAFMEYADLASRHLGDRVKHWMTLNEPFVSALVGHLEGRHAPGHTDVDEALAAAHHLLLGHGWAVPVIRDNRSDAQVGIVLNLSPHVPASPSEADQAAARIADGILNRWFLDPLAGKGYPQDIVSYHGCPMSFADSRDMEAIAAPLDFLGVNYYFRRIVRSEEVSESDNEPPTVVRGPEETEMGWEVHPESLYDILTRVHTDYDFSALYVTENGAAYPDTVGSDGEVEDPKRVDYLRSHLDQAALAIQAGVPLKGYFAWSFLDNFEWAYGYSKRFGLVYVDYETLERIPKASAAWYSKVVGTNAVVD